MSGRREQLAKVLACLSENNGDENAWAGLYDLALPRAMAVAFRLARGRRQLAEDIVQDAFLRLFRYTDFTKVGSPEDFYRYLAKVVKNVYRDHIRKELGAGITGVMDVHEHEKLTSNVSPSDLVENSELLARIEDRLTGEERRLVRLLAEGLRVQEIADRLGLSYSNAGVRIHRIRRQLHKYLNANEKI